MKTELTFRTIRLLGIFALVLVPILTISTVVAGEQQSEEKKILILYFSRVGITDFDKDTDAVTSASLNLQDSLLIGNTGLIARMIKDETKGDIYQIRTVRTYPENYRETTAVAKEELQNNIRPELQKPLPSIEDYDIIFLGYPNWWNTIPMALVTFLENYDWDGKIIVPFVTHGGGGFGRSLEDIGKFAPKAQIEEGIAIPGRDAAGASDQVREWLGSLESLE